MTRRLWIFLSAYLLLIATLFSFRPCLDNGFLGTWDDDAYVLGHPHIHALTPSSVIKVFGSPSDGVLYVPVTMLSLMVDHQMSHHDPFGYHLTNLLFHSANVLLVFSFFLALGVEIPVALGTALLFGIHPLRVESVAWVTERKDVLSGFFFLLGLNGYVRSRRQPPGVLVRLWVLFLFCLAVLSKPTLVVFPAVLCVIDRVRDGRWTRRSFIDKIPFVFVSAVVALVTFRFFAPYEDFIGKCWVSGSGGLGEFVLRWGVTGHSVAAYLGKILWPVDLSCAYAYPSLNLFSAAGYIVSVFILLPALGLWGMRRGASDKIVLGAGLFLATLFPYLLYAFRIEGWFPMADRYTYLPSLGISFLMAVALRAVFFSGGKRTFLLRVLAGAAVLIFLLSFSFATRQRCRVWHDRVTLWNDAVEKDPERCFLGYFNRGMARLDQGYYREAREDFDRASRIAPRYCALMVPWGHLLCALGEPEAAMKKLEEALASFPEHPDTLIEMGRVHSFAGNTEKALDICREVLARRPRRGFTYHRLGLIYEHSGMTGDAERMWLAAIEIEPYVGIYYDHLRWLYERAGQADKKARLSEREAANRAECKGGFLNRQGGYRG